MQFKRVVCVAMMTVGLGAGIVEAQVGMPRDAASDKLQSTAATDFLRPYGLEHFSAQYIDAFSTLLEGQRLLANGDTPGAQQMLADLWSRYPAGDIRWSQLPTDPFGINLGNPPFYYALRMLTDTVDWRMEHPDAGPPARTARLTVLLAGASNGIEPRTHEEIKLGTGVHTQHTLEPLLLENDSAVIHDSLRLFREYVVAITEGDLDIEVHVVHLPELDVSVHAGMNSGRYFASIADMSEVWAALDQETMNETDWWWMIYPSHVPEQHHDFQGAEFITGGMGTGPDSASPLFIIDDRWLVRKPPHLGEGQYTDIEREVYLPQWLQHEFYHHLFRIYPEFELEEIAHQWFDRSTWPTDFAGRYEPDYYHEALYRRLQDADRPLVAALRYASTGQVATLADLAGIYVREPTLNKWHLGSILISPQLEWLNTANVRWRLYDDLKNGQLLTGPDCPYHGTWGGDRFHIVWERDDLGDEIDQIRGFSFVGELYQKISP